MKKNIILMSIRAKGYVYISFFVIFGKLRRVYMFIEEEEEGTLKMACLEWSRILLLLSAPEVNNDMMSIQQLVLLDPKLEPIIDYLEAMNEAMPDIEILQRPASEQRLLLESYLKDIIATTRSEIASH